MVFDGFVAKDLRRRLDDRVVRGRSSVVSVVDLSCSFDSSLVRFVPVWSSVSDFDVESSFERRVRLGVCRVDVDDLPSVDDL